MFWPNHETAPLSLHILMYFSNPISEAIFLSLFQMNMGHASKPYLQWKLHWVELCKEGGNIFVPEKAHDHHHLSLRNNDVRRAVRRIFCCFEGCSYCTCIILAYFLLPFLNWPKKQGERKRELEVGRRLKSSKE